MKEIRIPYDVTVRVNLTQEELDSQTIETGRIAHLAISDHGSVQGTITTVRYAGDSLSIRRHRQHRGR